MPNPPVQGESALENIPKSPFAFANPNIPQGGGAAGNPEVPGGEAQVNIPKSPFVFANPNIPQGGEAAGNAGPSRPPSIFEGRGNNPFYQYLPLSQAISKGDLGAVKAFLGRRPDAVTAWINAYETAMLKACCGEQVAIVKELLMRMNPDQLLMNAFNHTPLTIVAVNGNMEIAEALLKKNPKLLEIPGQDGHLAVTKAVFCNQKEMARYLYSRTPIHVFVDNYGDHGILLLSAAIFYDMLDLALDLFEACPLLAVTRHPRLELSPITTLASRPALFPSGSQIGLWKRLIYSCIDVKLTTLSETFTERPDQGIFGNLLRPLYKWCGIPQLYHLKKTHLQARKFLSGVAEETLTMNEDERTVHGIHEAFFFAVRFGNVDFLVEMIRNNSELLWAAQNSTNKNIFLLAVEFRQEKVFSLFYGLDERKDMLIGNIDIFRNTILHVAGFMSPADKLAEIPGAALQMQRELQWFKEIESIVPEIEREKLNSNGKTPRQLFIETHEPLLKEAEKSMKDTATSCSVVTALIVTITFAAAFTVPGGINEFGNPLRVKDNRFMVFIISDIISFFASCTSVLIFLGILTGRYSEDDFLMALPTKMIAGLSILLISIAAMLVAFSSALFTLLYRTTWIVLPVILLACLPVILFVLLQYPLLVEMIVSTYGRGIFNRKMRSWM